MKPLVKVILTQSHSWIYLKQDKSLVQNIPNIIALYVDTDLDKMDFYKFIFGQGLVLYYQL